MKAVALGNTPWWRDQCLLTYFSPSPKSCRFTSTPLFNHQTMKKKHLMCNPVCFSVWALLAGGCMMHEHFVLYMCWTDRSEKYVKKEIDVNLNTEKDWTSHAPRDKNTLQKNRNCSLRREYLESGGAKEVCHIVCIRSWNCLLSHMQTLHSYLLHICTFSFIHTDTRELAKAAEQTGRCETLQRLLTAAFSESEPPLFSPYCCRWVQRLLAQYGSLCSLPLFY